MTFVQQNPNEVQVRARVTEITFRVIKVFTEQSNDLWLYEEQLARWKKDELTTTQRQEVERLGGQRARLRDAIASILSLAEELKRGTIESVLAKSDIDLALEALSGKRRLWWI